MNLGLDISQIVYKGTGVARFTEGFVQAILDYDTAHSWTFMAAGYNMHVDEALIKKIREKNHEFKAITMPPKLATFFWNDLHTLPVTTFLPHLDWFISSDWTEPPAHCKKATIVHDVIFKRYPQTIDSHVLSVMEKKLPLVAKESKVIFADSEATKNDLVEFFAIPSARITVNYPGVSSLPAVTEEQLTTCKSKFKLEKPFFVTVGKLEPRKNIEKLCQAFAELKTSEYELLVIGEKGWGDTVKPVDGVRLLGFVSDEELACLYKLSHGLIFPSLYEGFGYPAVEAMKLGTPVAMSNRSSLAEIGSNAALLFDPEQSSEITKAIQQLMNEQIRKELSEKGLSKSTEYNWEQYYKTFISTLEHEG